MEPRVFEGAVRALQRLNALIYVWKQLQRQ